MSHITSTKTPSVTDLDWSADELGPDFQQATLDLGPDPDGEAGPVCCTLVRRRAVDTSRPAVIWVHGMTDYYFHAHVARALADAGYELYGLDLRKCGRSRREGQTWHHVSSQSLYDADIATAARAITAAHPAVLVLGHSTGGLDVVTWAARLEDSARRGDAEAQALLDRVAGLILNSPWLGLQFPQPARWIAQRAIPTLGRLLPRLVIKGGINPAYGQSLHVSREGRWDFNTTLKPLNPREKYLSWFAGVLRSINALQSGRYSTSLPVLLLSSDGHALSTELNEETFRKDAILMPWQMRRHIRNIAPHAQVEVISGAVHDVFLSAPRQEQEALDATVRWIRTRSRIADAAPASATS